LSRQKEVTEEKGHWPKFTQLPTLRAQVKNKALLGKVSLAFANSLFGGGEQQVTHPSCSSEQNSTFLGAFLAPQLISHLRAGGGSPVAPPLLPGGAGSYETVNILL